jgi:hypothetical protein
VSTDRQPRTWTDEEVAQLMELAYWSGHHQAFEAGRAHERNRIADAAADVDATWITDPVEGRYERLVAARIADMEANASTPERTARWLQRSVDAGRRHTERILATPTTPLPDDWRAIRPMHTESEWERIWYDLSPITQADIADLAPASATGRILSLMRSEAA